MPDCAPFRIYVGGNLPEVLLILVAEMKRRGFQASDALGSESFAIPLPIGGTISGSYTISGMSLAVSISQRPEEVSCGTIESKMQDLILDAKAELKNRNRLSS